MGERRGVLDDHLLQANTRAVIIDATLGDAKKKLAKVKFAYDRLPVTMRMLVRLVTANTEVMKFSNGSEISIGTTFRGDTPQILHVSEYGKISAESPETARNIRTGAFNAFAKSGKIFVESTAHGVGGEFYDLLQRAAAVNKPDSERSSIDWKLHFFACWMDPGYRLPPYQVAITSTLKEYFEDLRVKHGIELDNEQKAWYAKMYEEQGPDDMKSEYPSCIEECFYSSLEGSYFKRQMTANSQSA